MTEYRVTWTIDIDADTAEEAARKALVVQRDASSIATVFVVQEIGPGRCGSNKSELIDLLHDGR